MLFPSIYVYNLFPATGHREFLLPASNPISVAVVGVGVFGRNHARVYKELEQQGEAVRLLGVVDPDVNRADAVAREFGCKAFGSVQQMLTTHSEVQAASVAAPTVHHLAVARELMKAGVDVLIEKPLAATLAEADELVALAATHKRIAQVGHLERFNPAVRATLPLLTQPMFFEVHRLSVFTPRSLDVDVVLDLMIHDLDIVLAFAKSPVKEVRAVGLPILVGKGGHRERAAGVRIGLHRELHRQPRFHRARAQAALLPAAAVCFARLRTAGSAGLHRRAGWAPAGTPSVNPQIGVTKPPVASEEPLHAELKSFPARGAGAVDAGGSAGRWTPRAGAGAGDCGGDSRSREESRSRGHRESKALSLAESPGCARRTSDG